MSRPHPWPSPHGAGESIPAPGASAALTPGGIAPSLSSMHLAIPVTLLYGGLCTLLVTLLGLNVSRLRGTTVGVGATLPAELVRPVRAHGNATEWVPLGLLLLLVLELSGAAGTFALHLLGGSLFLGRVLHAAGLYGRNRLSIAGATLTYLVLLVMSGWAVVARLNGP